MFCFVSGGNAELDVCFGERVESSERERCPKGGDSEAKDISPERTRIDGERAGETWGVLPACCTITCRDAAHYTRIRCSIRSVRPSCFLLQNDSLTQPNAALSVNRRVRWNRAGQNPTLSN